MRLHIFFCLVVLFAFSAVVSVKSQNFIPITPQSNDQTAGVLQKAMEMSPQMKEQMMNQFRGMTPEQRQAVIDKLHSAMQGLSPQDIQNLKDKAMAQWQGLPQAQKDSLKSEALDKWQTLSPEDKQKLINQFQNAFSQGAVRTTHNMR